MVTITMANILAKSLMRYSMIKTICLKQNFEFFVAFVFGNVVGTRNEYHDKTDRFRITILLLLSDVMREYKFIEINIS